MKKNLNVTAAALLAALSFTLNAHATDHPLEPVIRDLNRIATDLDGIEQRASADQDIKKMTAELRARTSAMGMDALMAPLRAKDTKIKDLGYEIGSRAENGHLYAVYPLPAAAVLEQEAKQLRPQKWQQLKELITQQQANLDDLTKLQTQADITGALVGEDSRKLKDVVDWSHGNSYEQLARLAQSNLNCINDIAASYKETGLRPLSLAGQAPGWDAEELRRTYGVMSLDQLPADKNQTVIDAITGLRRKALKYGMSCVSKETTLFFSSEIDRLKGNVK